MNFRLKSLRTSSKETKIKEHTSHRNKNVRKSFIILLCISFTRPIPTVAFGKFKIGDVLLCFCQEMVVLGGSVTSFSRCFRLCFSQLPLVNYPRYRRNSCLSVSQSYTRQNTSRKFDIPLYTHHRLSCIQDSGGSQRPQLTDRHHVVGSPISVHSILVKKEERLKKQL